MAIGSVSKEPIDPAKKISGHLSEDPYVRDGRDSIREIDRSDFSLSFIENSKEKKHYLGLEAKTLPRFSIVRGKRAFRAYDRFRRERTKRFDRADVSIFYENGSGVAREIPDVVLVIYNGTAIAVGLHRSRPPVRYPFQPKNGRLWENKKN